MIGIFELFWSAPIELRVIILAGLISPVFLLRNNDKKGTYEYHDNCYCDICKHLRRFKKFS